MEGKSSKRPVFHVSGVSNKALQVADIWESSQEVETDFDNSTAEINFIPQDIARVLMNLFNNAFYVVNEQITQNFISYNQRFQ